VELMEKLMHMMEEHERRCLDTLFARGLTLVQIHYLDEICRLGEPALSEIALHMGVSRPTATIMVKQLEKGGYLVKERDAVDRRSFRILLTEEGREIAHAHAGIHRDLARRVLLKVDDVLKSALGGALEQIVGDD
jgi:DNA-binding MarR family transcriptional regulator